MLKMLRLFLNQYTQNLYEVVIVIPILCIREEILRQVMLIAQGQTAGKIGITWFWFQFSEHF